MTHLGALGSEQTRRTYRRHGMSDPLFGVKWGDMRPFAKRIGVVHDLAQSLWATGNGDARVLATMVADPSCMTETAVDAWLADCDSYPLVDALVAHVAVRMPDMAGRAERWVASDRDRTGQAGWQLMSAFATSDVDTTDDYFEVQLETIEQRMPSYGNWTRRAANAALISIGLRDAALENAARRTATRLGHVDFDSRNDRLCHARPHRLHRAGAGAPVRQAMTLSAVETVGPQWAGSARRSRSSAWTRRPGCRVDRRRRRSAGHTPSGPGVLSRRS